MKKLLFLVILFSFFSTLILGAKQVHAQDEMSEAERAELEASTVKSKKARKAKTSYWGVSMAYYSNGLKVDLTSTQSVSMSGSSFGIGGFYQYYLKPKISLHLDLGLKPFNVSGTANVALCNSTKDCQLKVNYIGGDALARYHFSTKSWSPWIGGGGSFQMAMSKENNVVDDSKIGMASSVLLSLGADWNISSKSKIPMMFNYYYYMASTNAITTQYALVFGYGF